MSNCTQTLKVQYPIRKLKQKQKKWDRVLKVSLTLPPHPPPPGIMGIMPETLSGVCKCSAQSTKFCFPGDTYDLEYIKMSLEQLGAVIVVFRI